MYMFTERRVQCAVTVTVATPMGGLLRRLQCSALPTRGMSDHK
jgi:hypothetical protein